MKIRFVSQIQSVAMVISQPRNFGTIFHIFHWLLREKSLRQIKSKLEVGQQLNWTVPVEYKSHDSLGTNDRTNKHHHHRHKTRFIRQSPVNSRQISLKPHHIPPTTEADGEKIKRTNDRKSKSVPGNLSIDSKLKYYRSQHQMNWKIGWVTYLNYILNKKLVCRLHTGDDEGDNKQNHAEK